MTEVTQEASEETKALNAQIDGEEAENKNPEDVKAAEEAKTEDPAKPEKSPEQRELERARRKIDRLYRQREEFRAQLQGLTPKPIDRTNDKESTDSESLTLSKAELQKLIEDEAKRLAPSIKEQQAQIEHRQKVIDGLAKSWGKEKFDSLAEQLDEALDGLKDGDKPKPAVDAIFEADEPAALIEYIADPDNAAEAEAISRMSAVQAGRAITKLEDKLKAKKTKPQPSKAPAPIEEIRGQGNTPKSLFDLDGAAFNKRRREQIANRR